MAEGTALLCSSALRAESIHPSILGFRAESAAPSLPRGLQVIYFFRVQRVVFSFLSLYFILWRVPPTVLARVFCEGVLQSLLMTVSIKKGEHPSYILLAYAYGSMLLFMVQAQSLNHQHQHGWRTVRLSAFV